MDGDHRKDLAVDAPRWQAHAGDETPVADPEQLPVHAVARAILPEAHGVPVAGDEADDAVVRAFADIPRIEVTTHGDNLIGIKTAFDFANDIVALDIGQGLALQVEGKNEIGICLQMLVKGV